MKILLGSIYVGDSKAYASAKFKEMCDTLIPEIDVVFVSDSPVFDFQTILYAGTSSMWATEICAIAKRQLGQYALVNGYDRLVWQGIDCYYHSREDWDALVALSGTHDICGAVIAGRTNENYPVCREFDLGPFNELLTTEHEFDPKWFKDQTPHKVNGYIGSDATFISRAALEAVDMSGYEEWWTRKDIPGTIGPDEWFMYRAIKDLGVIPCAHRGVRPWHCHEDGVAKRYPGETKRLEEISWLSSASI